MWSFSNGHPSEEFGLKGKGTKMATFVVDSCWCVGLDPKWSKMAISFHEIVFQWTSASGIRPEFATFVVVSCRGQGWTWNWGWREKRVDRFRFGVISGRIRETGVHLRGYTIENRHFGPFHPIPHTYESTTKVAILVRILETGVRLYDLTTKNDYFGLYASTTEMAKTGVRPCASMKTVQKRPFWCHFRANSRDGRPFTLSCGQSLVSPEKYLSKLRNGSTGNVAKLTRFCPSRCTKKYYKTGEKTRYCQFDPFLPPHRQAFSARPSFQGLSLYCDRPFLQQEVGA